METLDLKVFIICMLILIRVSRWSYDLWYLWLFPSVCGRAPPCYFCEDFIIVEHAFTAGGVTHCIGRKKRIAQFQSESCWRVSETRLGAIEYLLIASKDIWHVLGLPNLWSAWNTVAIGRTMTQRKNHFWSVCCGNGIYHASECLDIVAPSGQAGARVGDLPP